MSYWRPFSVAEISADPTAVSDQGWLYAKDDAGDTELYWRDDSGDVVQLTQDGAMGSLSTLGRFQRLGIGVAADATAVLNVSGNFKYTAGMAIYPTTNAITSLTFNKSDGTSIVLRVDTTNTIVAVKTLVTESPGNIQLNGSGSYQGNIRFGTSPSASYDTNLLYVSSNSYTMGMICSSVAACTYSNGPYFNLRGNDYTAIANQRGLAVVAAGYNAAFGALEGSIRFYVNTEKLYGFVKNNGYWGIGYNHNNPQRALDVYHTSEPQLRLTQASNKYVEFLADSNSVLWIYPGGTEYLKMGNGETVFNDTGGDMDFRVEGDSLAYAIFLDATATTENIALLTAAAPNWQGMDRGIFLGDVETAPTGNPSSGGFLYSNAGALTWRGSSGTITTIAPAEPHCPVCGKDYMHEWENEKYGYLAVCMACLADEIGDRPWILRRKRMAA